VGTGLPSGTVTFAFVDVVGSTAAFTEHGGAFVSALERLLEVVADSTAEHGGVVVKTEGDGAFLAFGSADAAVRALVSLQQRIEVRAFDDAGPPPRLRVRAGAHTGAARPVASDYVALPVNVAARVTSAAGAGQVLITPAVVAELRDEELVDLAGEPVGEYALKDVRGPSPLHRVAGPLDPPRAPPYRRTNVAEPMTSFVGRSAEIAELRQLVAAHRLVTVVGPGGMGKTRLTSELLLEIAESYDAGAWLVELASVTEPAQVLGQVASGVGSTATTDDGLADDLAGRGRILVLLDNCEHVIDAAADVATGLLGRVAGLRVLATSREPLQIEGEVQWRIPALSGDDARCTLFLERLATAASEAGESPHRAAVVELCASLDGSPLAIELASVHARDVPIDQLLSLVRQGDEPLARRGGGRQSSLDAVLGWSIDRLDAAPREALLVLSLVPARLTFDEATMLLSDVADAHRTSAERLLRTLVRVSLVDRDGDHYRLLDTIRAAARRALRPDERLLTRARSMLHRTAATLADPDHDFSMVTLNDHPSPDRVLLLEEAVLDAWRDRQPGLGAVWNVLAVMASFRPMSARLRDAAVEVLETKPGGTPLGPDDALRMTGAFHLLRHSEPERLTWTDADIDRFADAVVAGSPVNAAARTLNTMAVHYLAHGRAAEADRYVTWTSELAARSDYRLLQEAAEGYAAALADLRGDDVAALDHVERALALISEDWLDWPVLITGRAESLIKLGRHEEALAILSRELARRPVTRDRWLLTGILAIALHRSGSHDDGIEVARELAAELASEPPSGPAAATLRYFAHEWPELFRERTGTLPAAPSSWPTAVGPTGVRGGT
jgi:predicted ATPase/class 3 adenylate cyclase